MANRNRTRNSSHRPKKHLQQIDAAVVAELWQMPSAWWGEPRRTTLPAPLRKQLQNADPPLLRAMLVEVVHRLAIEQLADRPAVEPLLPTDPSRHGHFSARETDLPR